MKRRILALLLAVLMLTTLTAAVFAEDATTPQKGVYDLKKSLENGYTLTVKNVNSVGGFYAYADTFTLECTGLTGDYSLVLLLNEETGTTTPGVPTENNLYYIDQQNVAATTTFTLKPKTMTDGTYTVYVSTNGDNGSLKPVASFVYGTEPEYMVGDANSDNIVDVNDAVHVLRYVALLTELNETQLQAADANRDGIVDVNDAVTILRYVAGLITSL